jgi:glycosyltransferase involved in cell wall biosynthesis
MPSRLVIVQTCLPDYRLPFFERLHTALPRMRLLCGQDYFTKNITLCHTPAPWRSYVRNHYCFGSNSLWQSGVLQPALRADMLIAEFNPRILSTWVILLLRKLWGKPTILWGHLWGHSEWQWLSWPLRLAMLRLGSGTICYTQSQTAELKQIMPKRPVWCASNSCVARAMCVATEAPATDSGVAYVGRLIASKKPRLLLEAFAQAIDRLPAHARLLLVGDGSERSALQRRVLELGLSGRVELPGHVWDENKLREIYRRSMMAVSPGYVGLSAIQAMAFGVPMLVSRHELHSPEIEACVEGQTCEFFETDSVNDLADRLAGFFQPDSPWPARRPAISEFIACNYTFDGMVEAFVTAINSTVGAKSMPQQTLAVVWAQFGPYHLARLKALKQELGPATVIGVEIGSHTVTYPWQRNSWGAGGVVTLLTDTSAEQAQALRVYRAALQVFRERRVRLVFVPSYWPANSLALMLAAKTAGARVIMMNETHAHTAKARGLLAWVKSRLVRKFDAALVGGQPHKEYFTSLGLAGEKIVTGYDVVDNDYFARASIAARADGARLRARHGLPQRYFLNVGRMVWKKNLQVLIDAYALLRSRLGMDCPRLVFVGGGKQEQALRERCLEQGLSIWQAAGTARTAQSGDADVFFHGFRQIEELPEFYAFATAFVLPSREEEWGLVVNEAMACGLPVLVSKVAGCARDLVRDGENGFIFDPHKPEELADRMERLAGELGLAGAMGAASQRIIADWGCERFAAAAREAIEKAGA